MSQYKYSATVNEHRARAVGLLSPISTKQGVEICNFIRGKKLEKARGILNEVIDMKRPVPFKRFTEGAGHKHGIGPGKYPIKACREILKLVNLVEANAQHKGLDTSSLKIVHICAKKGPKSWHYGRQSRIAMKRTHVEIVVEEREIKKKEVKKEIKKTKTKKPVKEEESKPIKKQEEKKEPEKEIKEKPKEKVKEKHDEEIKEEETVAQKTEKVETKEQEKLKSKTEEVKEKSKGELKKEEHRKAESNVKEIREKLQQGKKSQKEKVPSAFELKKKKESKGPKNNKTKLIKND